MNTTISTNRELYRQVTSQLKKREGVNRALGLYLSRLWQLVSARPTKAAMSLDEFANVLDTAFDGEAPQVEYGGLRVIAAEETSAPWLRQLARQIVDLHEMHDAGTLEDEYRYFGIDAPSGARWYNFDPHTFIECGITGTFGGWEEADDTARQYVPGPVAVRGQDGTLTTANPEDIGEPVISMESISWDEFGEFLWAGQCYE